MNRLITALNTVCRERFLDEKWLLAPSLRVGHQWLTQVILSGQPLVNAHIKTLTNMALEIAKPLLAAEELKWLSSRGGALLVDRLLHRFHQPQGGYLWGLAPSAGLAQALYQSIHSIRLAGLTPTRLAARHFEVATKGREVRELLLAYEEELRARRLVDYADVLRLATKELSEATARRDNWLILTPEDPPRGHLEEALLEKIPESHRIKLPIDGPIDPDGDREPPRSDLDLLSWLPHPASAPLPRKDGSARLFRAIGEMNEVREVLRRCLEAGCPLDQVELLHTDADTYVPHIYETFCVVNPEQAELRSVMTDQRSVLPAITTDDLPVTFQEGIPTRLSRPGRALTSWISWLQQGCPQALLTRMIQEGLLEIPGMDQDDVTFARLSRLFRAVPIGMNRERYLPQMGYHIQSLEHYLAQQTQAPNEDGETRLPPEEGQRRLRALVLLREFMRGFLEEAPPQNAGPLDVLARAGRMVKTLARAVVQLDYYARDHLAAEIDDMIHWLTEVGGNASLDIWDWLATLPSRTSVGGSGPRSGCLHVAHVFSGGHSGRPHTFLVGFDDGRFPGHPLQDPILLDAERRKLSPHLVSAGDRSRQSLDQFYRLLARLEGAVTLSFSCHHISEDHEMFPSPVILAAYHLLSGEHHGDQADLARWLPAPASFAPERPDKALDDAEWWLWRLSGGEPAADPRTWIGGYFRHLGRGLEAARHRSSDLFTIYDGLISTPSSELDPTSVDGPIISAGGLETLGRCPLAYFFQKVLRLQAPEEYEIDPDRWLDPATFGELLHELFERFMTEVIASGQTPDRSRHWPLLENQLKELTARYIAIYPPPSQAVYRRQFSQLEQAARVFLVEEDAYCRQTGMQPLFVEATLGMPSRGNQSPLDCPDPVAVPLNDGGFLRGRGRIDRVDYRRDGDVTRFAIWDYKSGSAGKYEKDPPFWQGRVIQHSLYLGLLEARLPALATDYPEFLIEQFGYFFPGRKARGARLAYDRTALAEGKTILRNLALIPAAGAFIATDEGDDCRYCDYQGVCGDIRQVVAASRRKLENSANKVLRPFLELRPRVQE